MTAVPDKIDWLDRQQNRFHDRPDTLTAAFSPAVGRQVQHFHSSMPGYRPTPLIPLKHLAKRIGVGAIEVKDESKRFGLNAFKVLGASYALCRTLADKLDMSSDPLDFGTFSEPGIRDRLKEVTCITATDGNHGRAVAYTAQQLGCRAVVYMPQGSSHHRLENIRRHGAKAEVIAGNYDDAVKLASAHAHQNGWLLVQDTAWQDYRDVPIRIMQGYLTMMAEIFPAETDPPPTHVLVQCGVGSFPAAIQAYLVQRWGPDRPKLMVVEPTNAACFYKSAMIGDGRPHKVDGDLYTLMAGLACGEPSIIAWEILWNTADIFVSCPDRITRKGMTLYGRPSSRDPKVVSGESGAVTLGLVVEIMTDPQLTSLKEALGLNATSRILLFSTEGDTDPDMYHRILRDPVTVVPDLKGVHS